MPVTGSGRLAPYYAHTMPGLEKIARAEIEARLRGARYECSRAVRGRNGLVLFAYDGEPGDLLKLRTVEDVFFLLARVSKLRWGREGLAQIREAMRHCPSIRRDLAAHRQATRMRRHGHLAFRVISRLTGGDIPYHRRDLQRAVEKGLEKRTRRQWQAVDTGEDAEIWANVIGRDFICGLRLSDASMRHRDYKVAHLPASLRPSVAAAMVWLSDPQPTDVFLDPMCGAATIVVERGMTERHTLLLGGDIDEAALRAAAQNIGRKHKPRQLFKWDARRLPLARHCVDKVVTNPPFGKKTGTRAGNPMLYRTFLREVDRVMTAEGRAVVLTSQAKVIEDVLEQVAGLHAADRHWVTILGQKACIYVIGRPGKTSEKSVAPWENSAD